MRAGRCCRRAALPQRRLLPRSTNVRCASARLPPHEMSAATQQSLAPSSVNLPIRLLWTSAALPCGDCTLGRTIRGEGERSHRAPLPVQTINGASAQPTLRTGSERSADVGAARYAGRRIELCALAKWLQSPGRSPPCRGERLSARCLYAARVHDGDRPLGRPDGRGERRPSSAPCCRGDSIGRGNRVGDRPSLVCPERP